MESGQGWCPRDRGHAHGPDTRPTRPAALARQEGKEERTRAPLFLVRPGAGDYIVKELIPDMELDAQAALDKAAPSPSAATRPSSI